MQLHVRDCGKVEDFETFWEKHEADVETLAQGSAAMVAPWYAMYRPSSAVNDRSGLHEIAADILGLAKTAIQYAIRDGGQSYCVTGYLKVEATFRENEFEVAVYLCLGDASFWGSR